MLVDEFLMSLFCNVFVVPSAWAVADDHQPSPSWGKAIDSPKDGRSGWLRWQTVQIGSRLLPNFGTKSCGSHRIDNKLLMDSPRHTSILKSSSNQRAHCLTDMFSRYNLIQGCHCQMFGSFNHHTNPNKNMWNPLKSHEIPKGLREFVS